MIAILLAAYNGEAYISQQIDSILSQTRQDWHLYISDDCSTDRTCEIVETYIQKYPEKITLYRNQIPSKNARNHFMKLATQYEYQETYLMFCDQDDFWLPEKIAVTLAGMIKAEKNSSASLPQLVHTDLAVVNNALETLHSSFFQFSDLPLYTAFSPFLVQNNVTGCTMMINQPTLKLLKKLAPADVSEIIMHDYWIGLICASMGKITILETPTMKYRQHSDNQVGAKDMQGLKGFYLKNKNPRTMRRNLQLHYRQAACFQKTYGNLLAGKKEQQELADFLSMFHKNLIQRGKIIYRHNYFAQRFIKKWIKICCYLLFATPEK